MAPHVNFSSLHDDILLYIFDFNTDMTRPSEPARKGFANCDDILLTEDGYGDSDSLFFASLGRQTKLYALTITLRTSQVCHWWRQLLLSSTSIWGRLIDLEIMSYTNILLRKELFRRAGRSSRLSVRGFNIPYSSPTCDFVFSLIRKHWARLEWVDIYILTKVKLSQQQTQFWRTITTPAPNLRHFSFVFSIPVTTNPQILTPNAPALRELCTSPSSPLYLESPWFKQLTYLSIDGVGEPTLQVTLPKLLDALSHLSRLERLRLIYARVAEGNYQEYPHIHLPSLRNLDLEDHFNTCFTVLRHLTPSSECAVAIRAEYAHDMPDEAYCKLLDSLKQFLKQRTYNNVLMIDMQPTYFSFVDAFPDCHPAPTLSIHISFDPQLHPEYALPLFNLFPCGKFKHVKNLRFRVNPSYRWTTIAEFLPYSNDFYNNLASLEVLKTTIEGFFLLVMGDSSSSYDDYEDYGYKRPDPLPRLQRIRMIHPSDAENDKDFDMMLGPQFVEQFVDLFKKRKLRHRSLKHLDVRGCMGDLRKLNQCKKLKVTWLHARYRRQGGEYICGSGDGRILDLDGE